MLTLKVEDKSEHVIANIFSLHLMGNYASPLSMGSHNSEDILNILEKELCIWSLTPCDNCGYVRVVVINVFSNITCITHFKK